MTQPKAALTWCPFPDRESARSVAATLLGEKLIACANILADVESVYEWDGAVSNGEEVAVLFKTTESCLDDLVVRLGECHPYDTPAIIGWVCDVAHSETLQWLALQCHGTGTR
ncbi:MAG: divalent-cation tolerance protein CutA [Erythrobacter sp.]